MIIKLDAGQLEWRSYVELSRDTVAMQELQSGLDIHTRNQEAFSLPTRLISKVFLFRWIYRGSAWAYSRDNDFITVSDSPDFWQGVIDRANDKYWELYQYQERLISLASSGKEIVIPTGRGYFFTIKQSKRGDYFWDIKQIVNYPNQGFGADIVQLGRNLLARELLPRYPRDRVLWNNTVHDDIRLDVDNDPELCYNICTELENLFPRVPKEFEKWYKYEFVTPLTGEVSFGPNMAELTKFKQEKGIEQFQ